MAITSPTYTPFLAYDTNKAAYWDTVTTVTGTQRGGLDPNNIGGSNVQVQFSRSEATGARENVALFDLNFSTNAGLGAVWSYLNDTTLASVETALDALWTTLKPSIFPHWVLSGYVWRHWKADFPVSVKTGFSKMSPIYRTTTKSVAGTATGSAYPADQVATGVTFRTASRKHWGRCYLPPVNPANMTQYGRHATAWCDTVAGAFDTLFATVNGLAAETHPVVWSPKYRGFFTVDTLAVDDIPDIIRRRRPYSRTYVKTYG